MPERKASEWMQLEKAAPQVNYRPADLGADKTCGSCRFFWSGEMRCAVVEGAIDATWISDLWTARIATVSQYYHEQDYGIFVETSFAAGEDYSKAQWIPFLPKPGVYKHKKYGDVEITPVRNQGMVDSVKNRVYQEHIPIDAEHQSKLSGAIGYLQDMRLNVDGSADAFVEFTPRGQTLLKADSFRYVSPEWFDEWTDPATEKVYHDVVIGGAITTRPFFKDKALRALVASEAGVEIISKEEPMPGTTPDPKVADPKVAADPETPNPNPDPAPPPPPGPSTAKTYSEDELKAEVTKQVEAAKVEAAKTATETTEKTFAEQLATETKAREAAEARLGNIEKADRTRRFTETVAGRGGSNDGGVWLGDSAKHVTMLETLSVQFGEDSEPLKTYIEQQNAAAQQFKEASAFQTFGTSGSNASGEDPDSKIEALARKRMTEDPKLTYSQAFSEVMESDEAKRLYEQGHGPATTRQNPGA